MSFLHIVYRGRKALPVRIDDGQNLLDRYVDLDTGQMYYRMGKQIAGRPIDPNGQLGRKLLKIARGWAENPGTKWF